MKDVHGTNPATTFTIGGSQGGWTVLRAFTDGSCLIANVKPLYRGVVSLYPVCIADGSSYKPTLGPYYAPVIVFTGGADGATNATAEDMRRLNAVVTRRQRLNAKLALIGSAQKALAMRYAAERADPAFNTRRSHEGLRKKVNPKTPSLIRPSERGRLRKAGAVAQAERDARPTNP